jgi:hypothetical protein
VPPGEDRAGVVDDDVQSRLRLQDPGDGRAHRRQRAHVGNHRREAALAVTCGQPVPQSLEALLVPADQHHPCAKGRQRLGRRAPDPGRRPGHQGGSSGQDIGDRRRPPPQPSAHRHTDPAEAADHGGLQGVIDQ